MTPALAADPRSFIETIDDLIASWRGPLRVEADTAAPYYDRERDLGWSATLVPLHKHELTDDSISGCEQVMAKIASKLIASEKPSWSNHTYSKSVAMLSYLIAERKNYAEMVAQQNSAGLAELILQAAE